jgi:hypothetical protein
MNYESKPHLHHVVKALLSSSELSLLLPLHFSSYHFILQIIECSKSPSTKDEIHMLRLDQVVMKVLVFILGLRLS